MDVMLEIPLLTRRKQKTRSSSSRCAVLSLEEASRRGTRARNRRSGSLGKGFEVLSSDWVGWKRLALLRFFAQIGDGVAFATAI